MALSFVRFGAHHLFSGTRRFHQFQVWSHLSSDHGETKLLADELIRSVRALCGLRLTHGGLNDFSP